MSTTNRKRYPSDLTDDQWELVEGLIPRARQGGRPREVDMREIINGAVSHSILDFRARVLNIQASDIAACFPLESEPATMARMTTTTRRQRRYDHRLKELVRSTGDITLAAKHGVPSSTACGWLTLPQTDVVTLDVFDLNAGQLQQEVVRLRRKVTQLTSLLRLALVVLRVSKLSFARARLVDGSDKKRLIRAIQRTRSQVPLKMVLRVIGLSCSRYHQWSSDERCGLDDRSSCPRSLPHQLTHNEVNEIRDMVTSQEYRHVPTSCLAQLAQRLGRVFASSATWHRLIRVHKWRRCRQRIHPARPKKGIRAAGPNEIWHVDTTMIRLLDGSRAYLHAVIDNFSQRILAWNVAGSFQPAITAKLLRAAAEPTTASVTPSVLVDGGVENYNSAMDDVIESRIVKRVLAQTEITFSNSMIESWWRVLKHQWLYFERTGQRRDRQESR